MKNEMGQLWRNNPETAIGKTCKICTENTRLSYYDKLSALDKSKVKTTLLTDTGKIKCRSSVH